MKTRIKKIIIATAALLFVCSSVSFAQDRHDRKPPGKAYGHYEVKKTSPSWSNKPFKPVSSYNKRYVYQRVPVHRYYADNHWRPAPRKEVIYKTVPKEPIVVFKIILK